MFAFLKSLRKLLRPASVTAAAMILASCQGAGLGGPSINTGRAVPVALLVPAGSEKPSDAILARSLENAARLAIADLEGARIDLRVYETAGDASKAAIAAREAVNDGAKLILGPLYSHSANAAGVAVASRNINVLSFSNNATIAGGNVFILGPTFQNAADRLVSHSMSAGRPNVMAVHDTSLAGQIGRNAIAAAAAKYGANFVASETYELSQNGIVQAIPNIAETARNSSAQTVLMNATVDGALPLLTQLMSENGLATKEFQYAGLTRWDALPGSLTLPGLQDGWFTLPDPGIRSQFEARYQAAFGDAPHPLASLSYDGIAAVGALVAAGDSGALTARSLTQSNGFAGASGIFRLKEDGTNERGLAVGQIVEGEVIVVSPAPRRFFEAGL